MFKKMAFKKRGARGHRRKVAMVDGSGPEGKQQGWGCDQSEQQSGQVVPPRRHTESQGPEEN